MPASSSSGGFTVDQFQCQRCLDTFKNATGLNIHRAKKQCPDKTNAFQTGLDKTRAWVLEEAERRATIRSQREAQGLKTSKRTRGTLRPLAASMNTVTSSLSSSLSTPNSGSLPLPGNLPDDIDPFPPDPIPPFSPPPLPRSPPRPSLSPPPQPRQHGLPKWFQDFLPTGISERLFPEAIPPPPTPSLSAPASDGPSSPKRRRILLRLPAWITKPTLFRTQRHYREKPSNIPDLDAELEHLLLPTAEPRVSEAQRARVTSGRTRRLLQKIIAPFPNFSSFLLAKYHHDGDKKSNGDFRRLQEVLSHLLFRAEDVDPRIFNKAKVEQALLDEDRDPKHPVHTSDGWNRRSVPLRIPPIGPGTSAETYLVEGLHYRSLAQVCRAALAEERATK